MKKTIAILLALCLCIGLCACGNGTSAQIEYPEDWDRIAEATATFSQYYNSHTADEFKSILEKSANARDIQTRVENAAASSLFISSTNVRHVQFVCHDKGYDLFTVCTEDVYKEEYLAQERVDETIQYCPEGETPSHPYFIKVGGAAAIPLKYEDGRYVIPANFKLYERFLKDYPPCECNGGKIAVPGDIMCETCAGIGYVETEPEPNSLGTALGHKAYLRCVDCHGWGTKDLNYVDCTVCSGKGYK